MTREYLLIGLTMAAIALTVLGRGEHPDLDPIRAQLLVGLAVIMFIGTVWSFFASQPRNRRS